MEVKLVLTEDGSHTLAVPGLDEHYHSIYGAVSESQYIFINAGLLNIIPAKKAISILEIGFGTGLNALLTLHELSGKNIYCEYDAIELNPVPEEIYTALNYPEILGIPAGIFHSLHNCKWNKKISISDVFSLHKILASAMEMQLKKSHYDLVYFDAFGPNKQPEMWSEEIFKKIYNSMKTGRILTTYSTKGNVKRI